MKAISKFKQLKKNTRTAYGTYALVIVVYAVMQLLYSTGSLTSLVKGQLVPICAYVIMALSLNLTVGILGELSLGHAGFMSVGAFSGIITSELLKSAVPSAGLRLFFAIIVGAVFAAFFGFLIGIPVLRLHGDYLAIVTLAFGEIIKSVINNFYFGVDANGIHISFINDKLALAEGGKVIIGGPLGTAGVSRISTFTAGFILIMVCLIFLYNLLDSKTGRTIMAMRDNAIAAESIGINVTRSKLAAFVMSAAMAGMAGALFGLNYSTLLPTKFDFNTSILVLVFVVLGGLGNLWGSVIAAAALTLLPELLRSFSDYRMLLYSVILILIMLATHSWLKGSFRQVIKDAIKKRKTRRQEASHE